jgi:hypothetical protein
VQILVIPYERSGRCSLHFYLNFATTGKINQNLSWMKAKLNVFPVSIRHFTLYLSYYAGVGSKQKTKNRRRDKKQKLFSHIWHGMLGNISYKISLFWKGFEVVTLQLYVNVWFMKESIKYCRVYFSQGMYETFVARNAYAKPLNLNFPFLELYRCIYCSYISGYIIQFYVEQLISKIILEHFSLIKLSLFITSRVVLVACTSEVSHISIT